LLTQCWALKESVVTVYTPFQQVQEFVRFAATHAADFSKPGLKKFLNVEMSDIFDFVVSKYTTEQGEQIVRPLYYLEIGGDCDDATIFWVSLLLAAGAAPDDILICEAKERASDDTYCHIFCGVKIGKNSVLWLDNLPGCKFGVLNYGKNRIKVTPVSRYL